MLKKLLLNKLVVILYVFFLANKLILALSFLKAFK